VNLTPTDLKSVTRDLIYKLTSYPFFPAKTEIFRSNLLNDLTKLQMLLEEMEKKNG
jgi:hypothetical protein